jgi:hypothetical protein
MEFGIWGIIKLYFIIAAAFTITSLFTLHFPAWKLVHAWIDENLEDEEKPRKVFFISHTIAYSLVTLIAFPLVAVLILTNNKEAVVGYTKSIIKGIIDDKTM